MPEASISTLKEILGNHFSYHCPSDVPHEINVGDQRLSPQWLLAASAVLIRDFPYWHNQRNMGGIIIPEFQSLPCIVDTEMFRNVCYQGSWPIFPDSFEGKNLIRYNRLQSWSYKSCI